MVRIVVRLKLQSLMELDSRGVDAGAKNPGLDEKVGAHETSRVCC